MSTATKVTTDLAALPNPHLDPAVLEAGQRMKRLESELIALGDEFTAADAKLREAEKAEVNALVTGDKDADKARAAVVKAREAREEIRRKLLTLSGAMSRLAEERAEALTEAQRRAIPAWTAARPPLVSRVEEAKAEVQKALNALRAYDDAATNSFLVKPKDAPVMVRFIKHGDGLGYNVGEVAGLTPAKARLMVEQGFAQYEERWRQVLHEVGR